MSEEWGPWIEWGCKRAVPSGVSLGDWYQGVGRGNAFYDKRVERNNPRNWSIIIRYRIRKPKGLTILERIASQPQERIEA